MPEAVYFIESAGITDKALAEKIVRECAKKYGIYFEVKAEEI